MDRTMQTAPLVLAVALTITTGIGARAQESFRGWGPRVFDSRWNEESFVEISAGGTHTLARRADGSVVAWGNNEYEQAEVPALAPGLTYVRISAGSHHSIALRSDGKVAAWGDAEHDELKVPALPTGLVYVDIAAGLHHSLARRSDGSVVAWGFNVYWQLLVPPLPPDVTYVEIAAGGRGGTRSCQ